MEAPDSPIADCYPRTFVLDPNGKPATLTWLWVARLPFIESPRLLAALAALSPGLTVDEHLRNERRGAEVSACEQHPVASDTVRALAEKDWVDISGLALGGRVKAPVVVRRGGSALAAVRYAYEQAPRGFHSSRIHPSFAAVPEPLPWPQVQSSVPRRAPRLPVYDDALDAMLLGVRPAPGGKGGKGGKGGRGGKGGEGNGGRGGGGKGGSACYTCGEEGHRSAECQSGVGKGGKGGRGSVGKGNGGRGGGGKGGSVCYTCGEEGHRSAECQQAGAPPPPPPRNGKGGGAKD
jgi:hypothetical protein